jgi:hypothetical protein
MTYQRRRGDLTDAGGVGLDLVTLEASDAVLVANTLVGRAALAQDAADGGELRLDVSIVDALVEDNNVAVWDDVLGPRAADLGVLCLDGGSSDEGQEAGREGNETLGELHDVRWRTGDVMMRRCG